MKSHNKSFAPLMFTGNHTTSDDDCACAFAPRLFRSPETGISENDCACPTTSVNALTRQNAHRYHQADGVVLQNLPHQFRLAFSPYAPQGPSVLNIAAWERWQTFQKRQPLSHPIDHLMVREGLILPEDGLPRPAFSQPDILVVWLHITNQCNLDCLYCYVGKTAAAMSQETGQQAIHAAVQNAKRNGFRGIKLKYAGGEPMLNFPLLRSLAAQARQLAQQHNLLLDQVVLSNGTKLRPRDVEWLVEQDIRLMISLDGIGKAHDRLRPRLDGRGSFAAIRKTIDNIILPAGLLPTISITVTRHNARAVADAVRWVLERDLPLSLNFYRQPPAANRDLAAEENAIIEGMLAAYHVIEQTLPTRPFFNGLLDRVQAAGHRHVCGAGNSYLVITHKGELAQCQMLLDQPVANNLEGNLLAQIKTGFIQNLPVEQKESCRDCVYRYRCAGGCPLETYRTSGRWNAPSPNCRIYKTLLPEALRLEGLRLLKVHGVLNG